MRNIKVCLAYIAILLVVGCATKKKSTSLKIQRSDTLILKKEEIKAPLLTDVTTIKQLCKDSVATEFRRVFVRDTDTVLVEVVDNSLTVRLQQAERTLSAKEETISRQQESIERLESTVKTKVSLRPYLYAAIIVLIFIIFPGIPKYLNGLVR